MNNMRKQNNMLLVMDLALPFSLAGVTMNINMVCSGKDNFSGKLKALGTVWLSWLIVFQLCVEREWHVPVAWQKIMEGIILGW